MADNRFALDQIRIRVSQEEILADLAYPAPAPLARRPPRPVRRRSRRRSR
jgi:hypothetical protein